MPAQIHWLEDMPDKTYLREALRLLVQSFIEMEVSNRIEADHYERIESRRAQRNGYRQRSWKTELGEIELFIPKLRKGSYYPVFLDSLRQSEPELLEFAKDAYERDADVQAVERLAGDLRLQPVHRSQVVEIAERLHDLTERHKLHLVSVPRAVGAPISALYDSEDEYWMRQTQLPQGRIRGTILALAA